MHPSIITVMPISPTGSVTPLTWVMTGLPSGAGPVPLSLPHAVKEAIAKTATAEIRIRCIRRSLHDGTMYDRCFPRACIARLEQAGSLHDKSGRLLRP